VDPDLGSMPDGRTGEHRGAGRQEDLVPNRRAVHVRVGTYQHVGAEPRWMTAASAHQRVLHHDRALADLDGSALRRQHGSEQDAGILPDPHVAAQHGGRRDVG
jgi:hypothetical protein